MGSIDWGLRRCTRVGLDRATGGGISGLQAATVTGYRLVGEKDENSNERRQTGEKTMERGVSADG